LVLAEEEEALKIMLLDETDGQVTPFGSFWDKTKGTVREGLYDRTGEWDHILRDQMFHNSCSKGLFTG
jgi:hypothetical protein